MDPINPIAESPESLENQNPEQQKMPNGNRSSSITTISMAIFVLMSLSVVGFLYYQNQQLKSMLAGYQTPIASSTPIATVDPTANWKTFQTNDFSVKYPDTLVASPSGEKLFLYANGATPEESETFVPNITIGNKYKKPANFTNLVSWAKLNTELYPNLVKESESKIGNQIFTTFESGSGSSAIAIHNLVYNSANIFDFSVRIVGSHEAEGNQLETYLPQILSTFKFAKATSFATPAPEQKACTMEAKICPDGSSVGRSGPNCEFAACPTP